MREVEGNEAAQSERDRMCRVGRNCLEREYSDFEIRNPKEYRDHG